MNHQRGQESLQALNRRQLHIFRRNAVVMKAIANAGGTISLGHDGGIRT